ncbi:GNAT family N-acetyltransferase [Levilactobacillus huananensis]|uniref:GNAT family N-acetyltransferase n=1 Tax=Levilactobacillus huananensis TaxID=2486019 RepID=UPI000F7B21EE
MSTDRLRQTLPWRDRLRRLLFLGLLDQPVPQGATYVDFVAVNQSQRRQGIGTALLKFCHRQSRSVPPFSAIGVLRKADPAQSANTVVLWLSRMVGNTMNAFKLIREIK